MYCDALLMLLCALFPLVATAQFVSVQYKDGGQQLVSLYGKPEKPGNIQKGILILPAWMGISQHEKDVAKKLNGMGFHTLIADIYGEGKYPKNKKEAGEIAGFYKTHIDQYRHRIRLALDQLVNSGADNAHIVVIGYCFGGTGALEAARANMPVAGVVSFHGGLRRDDIREENQITPKILVLHGADDFFVTPKDIMDFQNEMRKAGADWQMNIYSNAVHAFTDPAVGSDKSTGAAYNAEADRKSWQDFLSFVKQLPGF